MPDQLYESLDSSTQFRTILLKGLSGTGKTYKAAQFPGVKVLFNLDNNLSGLTKLPAEVRKDIRIVNPRKKDGKEIKDGKLVWDNYVEQLAKVMDDASVNVIILDSLTTLAEVLFDKILGSDKPEKKVELQHWNDFQRYLKWMGEEMLTSPNLDKHVIIIAHEELQREELTQNIMYTLNIGGKMKTGFEVYFSDVWRTIVSVNGLNPVFKLRTQPAGNFGAKCSLPDVPPEIVWDEKKDLILKHFAVPTKP